MQRTMWKKALSFFLCMVLIAAMALITTGCSDKKEQPQGAEKTFKFTVVDPKGNETAFEITTRKSTVGEALMDEGLIDGEAGQYGLYVKTVNGLTLDYDKDKMYWAFYVDGQYGLTGVDMTQIDENSVYCFKAEAG